MMSDKETDEADEAERARATAADRTVQGVKGVAKAPGYRELSEDFKKLAKEVTQKQRSEVRRSRNRRSPLYDRDYETRDLAD